MISVYHADVSLKTFYQTVYLPLNLVISSDSCRKQYDRNIRRCSELLGRPAMLSDLSDDLIAAVARSVVAKGRSPATGNKVRSQLVALWNFAARRGYLATYPAVPKMQEYTRVPTGWQQNQLLRLWESCERERGTILDIPAAHWWLNVHGVLWDTAARIGTIVAVLKGKPIIKALEWTYLDLYDGSVRIIAEHQKHKADQSFTLHADTVAALRHQKPRHRRWVFPFPYCEGTLYNRYERILERADLPHGPRDKFHRMRRSVASWYEAAGGNATELLGHSSRRVTRAYLDPLITGSQHPSEILFRPKPR